MLDKILSSVKLGMTRDEVRRSLGEPDDYGRGSRKYPAPSIYKYGIYEIAFEPWKSGGVVYIMTEDHEKIL